MTSKRMSEAVRRPSKATLETKMTQQEKMELREVFLLCDQDQSGSIDWRELRAGLRALGFAIRKREAKGMIREADSDGNGFLEFDEFVTLVEALSQHERNLHREILEGFRMFDVAGTGFISASDLKTICSEVGETIGDSELRDMIEVGDADGDGKISQDEFVKIMLKTNLFRL
eukprot:m.78178 g.78178  ORF g.78178 m.78178 type:complete len:173 (-) comp50547_c0_seq1:97-615(-)